MKLGLGLALAMSLTIGLLAAQENRDGDRITVAGCLQRAQRNGSVGGTVVGTSASPNTADDEANSSVMVNAFLLTEAVPVVGGVAPPAEPSAAAVGTTGSVGTPRQITSFGLSGREAELERHQGARLEVTGTVEPAVSSGRGTGGAATASGVKRIKVESFKILAEKCDAR